MLMLGKPIVAVAAGLVALSLGAPDGTAAPAAAPAATHGYVDLEREINEIGRASCRERV